MDFDHRSKHNLRFHQDMVKRCKHIRYEVVGAPRNPLEAAARRTVAQSTCVVTNACVTQDEGKMTIVFLLRNVFSSKANQMKI